MRQAVGGLHGNVHVAVVQDLDVAGGDPNGRGSFGGRPAAGGGRSRGQQQADAAGEDGPPNAYRVLPVIAKCARRFRAQQVSPDSWQSGISLPYDTVFSRSAATPSETR